MAGRHPLLHLPLTGGAAVVAGAAWLWVGRPAGAEPWRFVGIFAGSVSLVALVTGLAAAWVGRRAPGGAFAGPLVTGLVLLVATPALAVRARAAMDAATNRIWSETMWEGAPELGEGGMRLRANVRDAVAVVPDRPIRPGELHGLDLDARITRRRTFRVSTNAAGLRGRAELASPKTHLRLVCLGGSVTFGHGVADEEAWCARMGLALGIEALNAGMPGRTPAMVAAWAERNLAALDPDVVLMSEVPFRVSDRDPLDDYADAARRVAAVATGARFAVALSPMSPYAPQHWPEGAAPDLSRSLSAQLPGVPILDTTPALVRAAEARGGLAFSFRGGVQRLYDRGTGAVLVEARGEELAAEVFDAFERDPALRLPFFLDNAHLDAEGHAVVADTVAAWLRGQGLVPE